MKPLKLEMQAFGPYVEKQTIDFERLSEKGMFLIKGSTGSGKTTVFDAISFALYGESTGEVYLRKVPGSGKGGMIGRNDLEDWRCNQAPSDMTTFVSFSFESGGRSYYFKRALVPKRINMAPLYEAGEIDEDGNIIPFFNNPKQGDLNAKAEELIGLSKEQFRQVVFLPQGQFERFLIAPSDEKEAILKRIFGTERWSAYAQKFYEAAYGRKEALREEKKEIELSLEEEGVSSLEELTEKIAGFEKERKSSEDAHTAFGGKKKQEELNKDIKLAEQFRMLHDLEAEKEKLDAFADSAELMRREYKSAEEAEALRPLLTEYEKASDEYERRKTALEKSEEELPKVKEEAEKAKAEKEKHDKESPVEELQKKIGEYETRRPSYERYGELDAAFRVAKETEKKAEDEVAASEKKKDELKKASEDAALSFNEADKTAREYREKYFKGIYGEIASELTDGEACPVCGSSSHPAPAVRLPGSVSREDTETKENERDRARELWEKSEEKSSKAVKEWEDKKKAKDEASGKAAAAESELKAASTNLIEGIEDLESLDNRIDSFKKEIENYREKSSTLEAAFNAAEKKLAEIQQRIKQNREEEQSAEEELASASDKIAIGLKEKGYDDAESLKKALRTDDERRALHQEIVEFETKCKKNEESLRQKSAELEGKHEPDSSLFNERQNEITEELNEYNSNHSLLSKSIEDLSAKKERLGKKHEHYNSEIKEAEADFAFAQTLRGDKSIGLQRYVLAVMFEQVISYANEMLSNVHGGRYRLCRTNDRGTGNKRGLELKVTDNRSPDKDGRNVSMLSGGEKFLVSLALSIGMSTVAQKTGVQIKALFIDEGFGTLDEDSISDAMMVLESVRKSSGMIGIISHVKLLESVIPTHLEVVKTDKGSYIEAV